MVSYRKNFKKLFREEKKYRSLSFACYVNSTANPAKFVWKLDKLGVLFQGRHGWQSLQDLGPCLDFAD